MFRLPGPMFRLHGQCLYSRTVSLFPEGVFYPESVLLSGKEVFYPEVFFYPGRRSFIPERCLLSRKGVLNAGKVSLMPERCP